MNKIYQSIEPIIAKVMFFLTILFLALIAIIIQYLQTDNGPQRLFCFQQIVYLLYILWPVFFLERILYLIFCKQTTWKSFIALFVITIIPPLRLTTRRCNAHEYIWWDNNWQLVNDLLYNHIEKKFLYPILVMSLIMIPFWLLEIFYPKISSLTFLYHLINFGNALIWGVFVSEFIIMISIAKKRSQYLIKHWLEFFIIILPLLALTRFIIIAKYIQVSKSTYLVWILKLQGILNIYRTKSVINRIIRVLIVIDVVKRFYQRKNPQKYLLILQDKLAEQEQGITEIKAKISEVKAIIEENQLER